MNKFLKKTTAVMLLTGLTLSLSASAFAAKAKVTIEVSDEREKPNYRVEERREEDQRSREGRYRKQQEEQRRKQEEEQRRQEEIRRKQQEEQRRKQEEEQRRQEEIRRKQQEEQRRQEEIRRKQQEEQRRQEEIRRKQQEEQRHQQARENRYKHNRNGKARDSRIKVEMYNGNTTVRSNTLYPRFKFTNTGNTSIRLSDIKFVYYYNLSKRIKQNYWCDWSNVGSDKVTGKFYSRNGGNEYCFEGGFRNNSGYLKPGQSVEAHIRIANDDWSEYNQRNHYSFNINASKYTEWGKIDITIGR